MKRMVYVCFIYEYIENLVLINLVALSSWSSQDSGCSEPSHMVIVHNYIAHGGSSLVGQLLQPAVDRKAERRRLKRGK